MQGDTHKTSQATAISGNFLSKDVSVLSRSKYGDTTGFRIREVLACSFVASNLVL